MSTLDLPAAIHGNPSKRSQSLLLSVKRRQVLERELGRLDRLEYTRRHRGAALIVSAIVATTVAWYLAESWAEQLEQGTLLSTEDLFFGMLVVALLAYVPVILWQNLRALRRVPFERALLEELLEREEEPQAVP